tara:strand:- start:767 stop:1168 length:402 start_codon:yes stop_codon:yes gene_type:complete
MKVVKRKKIMITVFYDGKCGLCSKEINHYRQIADDNKFNWQDITESTKALERNGVSLAQGLRFLHATDSSGRMHVGVDAFILIWSNLNRWRMLSRLTSLPLVYQSARLLYRWFAAWRFKRLEHCKVAASMESI